MDGCIKKTILYDIVCLFLMTGFLGWIIECFYEYAFGIGFVNRGFLFSPFIPIYGFGVLILRYLFTKLPYKYTNGTRFIRYPVAVFTLSMVAATIFEYTTSYIMERALGGRWWDYSQFLFNISGRVCLHISLLFGCGGLLLYYAFIPWFQSAVSKLSVSVKKWVTVFGAGVLAIDFSISLYHCF